MSMFVHLPSRKPSHSGDKSIYKILFNVKNRLQELLNWGSMPHYFPGRTVSSVALHQVGWNLSRIVDEEDDAFLKPVCGERISCVCTYLNMIINDAYICI